MNSDKNFTPLMIDLSGKKIIIFGAGSVGERKALFFSAYADTTIISTSFTSSIKELENSRKIKLITSNINSLNDSQIKDLIYDAFMVIPATNNRQLNQRITEVANKTDKNILVNQVDDIGDVIVPSVIKRGDLTIGISTLGSSPAISKFTRENIEQTITPEYSEMAEIQNDIRTYLKEVISDQRKRKQILWNIIEDDSVWSALSDSYEKAYNIALNIVDEQLRSEKID
ncbi:siroheme synthase [Methanohalobium evestigatum Z-7303]|uniref:precorrin-2 dehydrogenase n=1 Tax=Methanohalobium evestigatum (strain ATCC BAA-1072 / DSM 3721 / NBRC 107634 / OCM 161 / Z-7303) TaxID=644295 RepID=D7E6D3_METEZ|nr:bifunctional precorrin-2 dehydrogenase/sirohydrochlorin ferrochelatase [Methanohalobium evestigatum]ADI73155.1 siroheme synthase [Methanohalobium evestigatum Z-7303]